MALEALRDALRLKKVDLNKVWRTAEACHALTIMRPYLEALTPPDALGVVKSGKKRRPDEIAAARYTQVMDRETVLANLHQLRSRLEARGIAHAGVFGSVARNEAKATSDIDIIVTPHHGRKLDLFDLGGVQSLLNEHFEGIDIDVVVEPVMRPDLLQAIRQDRVNAF